MKPLSYRTLAFLVKGDKVLLGYKKTGFGKGNYLGIGGKIEDGESEEVAVTREIVEEICVSEPKLKKVAELTFLFPEKPTWDQHAYVFLCSKWEGEPTETDEIKPEWRNKEDLPFAEMWDDARFWLPSILRGETLKGTFVFNSDLKVKENFIKATDF
jgi:8-oxo-dGTP diphosphatase